jgi:L-2-hydroxycarboxylate dehydrogenase (NAD+)
MNRVPEDAIRVRPEVLRRLVQAIAVRAGMGEEQSALLAELLVQNDLRGVFSHGSRQIKDYGRLLRDGRLNARPVVRVLRDTPVTLLVDGDAGLGYFPCWQAARALVARAREHGIACAVTRHHGHFGAAGLYTRVAAAAGLIGYATSGHQLALQPGGPLLSAAGGSPMSFAVPAGEEPPVVLDFGAIHDLYSASDELLGLMMERLPSTLFRSLGLGAMCQMLGGFLAGVPLEEGRAVKGRPGANQGALLVFVNPAHFIEPAALAAEVDAYQRMVAQLRPFPGTGGRATLPGRLEWEREQAWASEGVPVGMRHREELHEIAAEFGVEVPF